MLAHWCNPSSPWCRSGHRRPVPTPPIYDELRAAIQAHRATGRIARVINIGPTALEQLIWMPEAGMFEFNLTEAIPSQRKSPKAKEKPLLAMAGGAARN